MIKLKVEPRANTDTGSTPAKSPKAISKVGRFRRYTNLAALIHLLQNRSITLLNPANWDDKNDAHFMAEYKRLRRAETVLAICFAEAAETYHHWRVFSSGADGVCISFDKKRLLAAFDKTKGITKRKVRYELVDTVAGWPELKADDLPFLKRKPYEAESEYRVIYESQANFCEYFDVDIELSWIKTITLSPWMPEVFKSAVTNTINSIDGCGNIEVLRSTLVGRASWKALASKAVP